MTKPLQLNFRHYGQGEPLLILHGLFGSHKNWHQQARGLAENFSVYTFDLRNHGSSPHNSEMNYQVMAADIIYWMKNQDIESANLLGHSMGGKVAMQLALTHSERVDKLVIVDIAPKHYPPHHDEILQAMTGLDFAKLKSRQEIDQQLQTAIPDDSVRQFILTNLVRNRSGRLDWQLNLDAIINNNQHISIEPAANQTYTGPTLFIKGAESDYIQAEDKSRITELFPNASSKIIGGAGHWPHAEKPQVFNKIVGDFLLSKPI